MSDLFLSIKIVFTVTNSLDPDEMLHTAAFHLGLHCLPMCLQMILRLKLFKLPSDHLKFQNCVASP